MSGNRERQVGPEALTVHALLRARSASNGERLAIRGVDSEGLSYTDLWTEVSEHRSTLIRCGIGSADVVAIALPNGPDMAVAFLSVACTAAAAPLNPALTRPEFEYYLGDLGVRAVIVEENDTTACSSAANELGIPVIRIRRGGDTGSGLFVIEAPSRPRQATDRPPTSSDVALYLHTSGTTSRPKMVPLSHENLCRSAANVASTLQLTRDDLCLNVMPLFHIHGLVAALLASLSAGAGLVCTPGFLAPRFFDWFEAHQPSWYTAVPTMHQSILSRADDRNRSMVASSPIRFIRSSSASLAPSVLSRMEEAFGVPVIEAYGMTEAAHQMTSNPLPPAVRKPGSVGRAAGPEVAIADATGQRLEAGAIGEVIIRGPNVTSGYRGMEDLSGVFHDEGWFRTGDQGYLDEDGYLFLTGRLKEIINRGGETIAPREIDEALLEHADVRQALAFSVPDDSLGEEVAAAVVLEAGSAADEESLQRFLADRLAFAKMPKRVVVLDEIPKGPTGKLQRIGLAERLGIRSVHSGKSTSFQPTSRASSDTEDGIAAIWREVLRKDDIAPDDDFLTVGGDSITASQLVVRVRKKYGLDIPLMDFFNASTISRQAALVDDLLQSRIGSKDGSK